MSVMPRGEGPVARGEPSPVDPLEPLTLTPRLQIAAGIRTAFAELKVGESITISDVSPFLDPVRGLLRPTLPAPDGRGTLGKARGIGLMPNIEAAELEITRLNASEFILRFSTRSAGDQASQVASILWDGSRYVTPDEYVLNRIKEAFSSIKVGEQVNIGDVSSLVSLEAGLLSPRFPNAAGAPIGKQYSFGGGEELSKVELSVHRVDLALYRLDFIATKRDGGTRRSRCFNEGNGFIQSDRRTAAHLRELYARLRIGESGRIVDIMDFAGVEHGSLPKTFPVPGGELQTAQATGCGGGLTAADVEVRRVSEAGYEFTFHALKADGARVQGRLYWDGKAAQLEREYCVSRIMALVSGIRVGERAACGDVACLSVPTNTSLGQKFPRFDNGSSVGSNTYLSGCGTFTTLELEVERTSQTRYTLRFTAHTDHTCTGTPMLYWDGGQFLSPQQKERIELQAVLNSAAEAAQPSVRESLVSPEVEVTHLISKSTGALLAQFPLPGSGAVHDNIFLGIPEGFSSAHASVAPDSRGILLTIRTEHPTGSQRTSFLWDGKTYVSMQRYVEDLLIRTFSEMREGEERLIDDIAAATQQSTGRLGMGFPLPGGGTVGDTWALSVTSGLRSCPVIVSKTAEGFELLVSPIANDGSAQHDRVLTWLERYPNRYLTRLDLETIRVSEAYARLRIGERTTVPDLTEVVRLSDGAVGVKFPLSAAGTTLGAGNVRRIGSTGLASSSVEILRCDERRYRLLFVAERETGDGEVRAAFITDGEVLLSSFDLPPGPEQAELLAEESSRRRVMQSRNRSRNIPLIRDAFQQLKIGESVNLGEITDLIYRPNGTLLTTFPRPDGDSARIGNTASGLGSDVQNVHLSVTCTEERVYRLDFAEHDSDGKPSRTATLIWRNGRYTPRKLDLANSVREQSEKLQIGEVCKFDDVSPLMVLSTGGIGQQFPLASGMCLDEPVSICAGVKLKTVALRVERVARDRYLYSFSALSEMGGVSSSEMILDSGRLYNSQDWVCRRIRQAFASTPVSRITEIGDVAAVINLTNGVLSSTFPTPLENPVGDQTYFGAREKVTSARLAIERTGDHTFCLRFTLTNQDRPTPYVVELLWDGAKYTDRQTQALETLRAEILKLQVGQAVTVVDTTQFLNRDNGILAMGFPHPTATGSIGVQFYSGLRGVAQSKLAVTRTAEHQYRLVFFEDAPRTGSIASATVIWDGSRYQRLAEFNAERVSRAFSELKTQESRAIGDISTLVVLRAGRLGRLFPRGDGDESRGNGGSFIGIGEDCKSVDLSIERVSDIRYSLNFIGKRDGKPDQMATLYWNGSEFISPRAERAQEILSQIQSLQIGQRVSCGSVSSLVSAQTGILSAEFPTPVGNGVGVRAARIGGAAELQSCNLDAERLSEIEFRLTFTFTRGDKPGSRSASLYWDGRQYLREEQIGSRHATEIAWLKGRVFEQVARSALSQRYGAALQFEPWIQVSRVTQEVRRPDFLVPDMLLSDSKWGRHGQDIAETVLKYTRLKRMCGMERLPLSIIVCDSGVRAEVVSALSRANIEGLEYRIQHWNDFLRELEIPHGEAARLSGLVSTLQVAAQAGNAEELARLLAEVAPGAAESKGKPAALPTPLSSEVEWQGRMKEEVLKDSAAFAQDFARVAAAHSRWWEWGYHKRSLMIASFLHERIDALPISEGDQQSIKESARTMYPQLADRRYREMWSRIVLYEKLLRAAVEADIQEGERLHAAAIADREHALFGSENEIRVTSFEFDTMWRWIVNKSAGLRRELGEGALVSDVLDTWPALPKRTALTEGPEPVRDFEAVRTAEEALVRDLMGLTPLKASPEAYMKDIERRVKVFFADGGAWSDHSAESREELRSRVSNAVKTWLCEARNLAARFEIIDRWKTSSLSLSVAELTDALSEEIGARSFRIAGQRYTGHGLVRRVLKLSTLLKNRDDSV